MNKECCLSKTVFGTKRVVVFDSKFKCKMLNIHKCFRVSNKNRIILLAAILYAIAIRYTYNNKLVDMSDSKPYLSHRKFRYILQWTSKYKAPFKFMGNGISAFIKNKCQYTNCYVTDNQTFFASLKDFDAIAFNGRSLENGLKVPSERSREQKYIFGAMESADNFPVCDPIYDGFFNWTWTYRLDSDFRFGYITIYDLNGTAVGPAVDMKWPNQLDPITDELKEMLSKKTKAGAWFVSNCKPKSKRQLFMPSVMKELKKYNWAVDIYGSCGSLSCPKADPEACFELIKKEYYFYFSFENSFSEDYVTEKLLTALNNYAIPVVFGAADYTRFLPPGSYLDARQLGPKVLAKKMNEIILNKTKFYDYFRWTNHYVYRETSSKDDICKLCEMMNNEEKFNETSEWPYLRSWWNGERYEINCKNKSFNYIVYEKYYLIY